MQKETIIHHSKTNTSNKLPTSIGFRFGLTGALFLTFGLIAANLIGFMGTAIYYLIQIGLLIWAVHQSVKTYKTYFSSGYSYFNSLKIGLLTSSVTLGIFYVVRLLANLIKYGTLVHPEILNHHLYDPHLGKLFILPAGLLIGFLISYMVANAYRPVLRSPE